MTSIDTHTDFVITHANLIPTWRSFDDIVTAIEQAQHLVGGNIFLPERIAALARLLIGYKVPNLRRVSLPFQTAIQLYAVDARLRDAIANTEPDALRQLAVTWSSDPTWGNSEPNRFDLAGFLGALQELCQEAQAQGQDLYLLLSASHDWEAASS